MPLMSYNARYDFPFQFIISFGTLYVNLYLSQFLLCMTCNIPFSLVSVMSDIHSVLMMTGLSSDTDQWRVYAVVTSKNCHCLLNLGSPIAVSAYRCMDGYDAFKEPRNQYARGDL